MKWDAAKSARKTVVMLSGEEPHPRKRALEEIVEVGSGGEDFDLETFVADASDPSQWLGSAGTAPFLSPRRTVVVRNLLRSDGFQSFNAKGLPDYALLVLVADDEPERDADRQRRLETNRKGWAAAVKSGGGEVLDFAVKDDDIRDSVKQEAHKHGKKINDRAFNTLKEMTGASLSRALEEVDKLALFVGKESEIKEADVKAVVMPSPEWSIFKLTDAVFAGNNGVALAQLRVMVGSNPKVEEVAYSTIIPMLSRHIRLLWQARVLAEAGTTPEEAGPEITSLFPEKQYLPKAHPYVQSRMMQAARNVDFATLSRCFAAISEADSRLKGMLPAFTAMDTLERMVLTMSQAVRPVTFR